MEKLFSDSKTEEKKPLLEPMNDIVFHALFREENKELTQALISDILKEKVKVVTTDKNRHVNLKDPNSKYGILDLRAELEGGVQCNIEIQLEYQQNENERFLYYWADAYVRQLKRGNKYGALKKTISIVILNHEIKELEGEEELGIKWQILDRKTGKRLLTDRLELVIIEIPKAIRKYKENKQDKISQWMMFLENPSNKEVIKIMDENENIRKAAEELNAMSEDDELRWEAELRLKGLRDEQAAIEYATNKGIEQGKIEIAKKLLEMKMSMEDIQKATGLTEEEIKKLAN